MTLYRLAHRLSAPEWTDPTHVPNRADRRAAKPTRSHRLHLRWWLIRWWS